MADKTAATAAVPAGVEQVVPGVPAVQVDPGNELLDGENLALKEQVLTDEPVHVDETGRRLVHDDADEIPAPQSANLEVRQRLVKEYESVMGSIGKGPTPEEDPMVAALRREREGLQRRADDGDERSKRRVGQVDKEISRLGGDKDSDADKDATPDARSEAATKRAAATKSTGSQSTPPAGRSSKPTTSG